MLNRVRERIHPQELVQARAVAETKPLATPPAPKPLGWGPAMLNHLAIEAPVERFRHGRYTVAALVPAGHLALVSLKAASTAAVTADAEAIIADVHALVVGLSRRTAKAVNV